MRVHRCDAWQQLRPKFRMRPGASHPGPHCSCVPDLPWSPRRRRNEGFHRQRRPKQMPCFGSLVRSSPSRDGGSQPLRWPAAFPLLRRAVGEGAASPATSRASAFLEAFPRHLLSRIEGAAGSAAVIRPSQELSRFAGPTLRHFMASRNTKNGRHCEETVDDETSLWKPEEISGTIFNSGDSFIMFSITYISCRVALRWIADCGKVESLLPGVPGRPRSAISVDLRAASQFRAHRLNGSRRSALPRSESPARSVQFR
jgi:hypothetical protein